MRQADSTRADSSAARLSLYQPPPKSSRPTILPPLVAPDTKPAAAGPTPVAARTGDHLEIHRFLRNVFHGPSAAEFAAQLEAPDYQPAQRLIVASGREIAAHVRLAPAEARFGGATLPICTLMDLATALPLRKRGFAAALVAAAEKQAADAGAVLGCVRTTAVEFFVKRGWAVCGRHSFSLIDPCRLIAAIAEREAAAVRGGTLLKPIQPRQWRVRPFLRYDLPAAMRLEHSAREKDFGAHERNAARWEWLLERKAFDAIFVAVDAERPDEVVGYLVACEGRIGELIVAEHATGAAEKLLTHFCREALEAGVPAIRFDAAPDDPRHALIVAAGGKQYHEPVSGGEAYCVKALDPQRLLEATAPVWRGAADELTLEIQSGDEKQMWHLDGRSGRVTSGSGGCRLQLSAAQLAPLVLGGLTGRALDLAAKNRRAAETAAAFFPPRPWYTPSWEQWTAR